LLTNLLEPTQQVRSLLNPREQAIEDVDYFPDTIEAAPPDKMAIYLGGKYKLPTCKAENCLGWWKVSVLGTYIHLLQHSQHLLSLFINLNIRNTIKNSQSCLF
jgi:hypothetical protein